MVDRDYRYGPCRAAAADPPTCNRVRLLTAGLPLFVHNLAQLAREQHNGDVPALCSTLERGHHVEATAQEALLANTLAALSRPARQVADLLSIARVAVTLEEIAQLAGVLGLDPAATGRAVRELNSWGVSRGLGHGRLQLHDAFRLLCGESGSISSDELLDAQRQLCTLLDPSETQYNFQRAVRYLELLPAVGEIERLIEIASNETEVLYERGLAAHVKEILENQSKRLQFSCDRVHGS